MPRSRLIPALLLAAGCVPAAHRAPELLDAPFLYVSCREALFHYEYLQVRADSFTHYIATDVGTPRRTTGSYAVRGDTIYLIYGDPADHERAREATRGLGLLRDEAEIPYPQRFLSDRIDGYAILWREARSKDGHIRTGSISPYAVLVRGDSIRSRNDAACAAVLRRPASE